MSAPAQRPVPAGPAPPADRDPVTRRAALWATVVAAPVTVAVAVLLLLVFTDRPAASPRPSASGPPPAPTSPVALAAPSLPPPTAAACRALITRLPAAVRDLARRPVTAGPWQNAAYGEPPITVACGSTRAIVAPDDFLLTMDGVCWHSADDGGATVFTAVDRAVPVRVTVPTAYEQRGQWANEFSGAVRATVPPARTAPSGCAP